MNYDRNVLGLKPIPQPKHQDDIYEYERKADLMRNARLAINAELAWDDEDEDD